MACIDPVLQPSHFGLVCALLTNMVSNNCHSIAYEDALQHLPHSTRLMGLLFQMAPFNTSINVTDMKTTVGV